MMETFFINVSQSVRSEDDDEFVVLQKPIGDIRRAFGEMRDRCKGIILNLISGLYDQFKFNFKFHRVIPCAFPHFIPLGSTGSDHFLVF